MVPRRPVYRESLRYGAEWRWVSGLVWNIFRRMCAHADLGGGWLTDSGSRTFRDVNAPFGAVAGIETVVGLASHAHGG
jgi:hypothetical protein